MILYAWARYTIGGDNQTREIGRRIGLTGAAKLGYTLRSNMSKEKALFKNNTNCFNTNASSYFTVSIACSGRA